MKKFSLIAMIFIVITATSGVYCKSADDPKNKIQNIATNDQGDQIAVNQMKMFFYNNGFGSHNWAGSSAGLLWPGGTSAHQNLVFFDGLLLGNKDSSGCSISGSAYRTGLQAGKIMPNGKADDPLKPEYKIWKLKKNWQDLPDGAERDRLAFDYNNWPVEQGAPWVDVNRDGIFTSGIDKPELIGDETNWFVMNDLDTIRMKYLYFSQPQGLEIQVSIFAFSEPTLLNNVIFKKYKFINKGHKVLLDEYIQLWSDPDIGDAGDDYVGSDSVLNMVYCYNGDDNDAGGTGYGTTPPAVGYLLVKGPSVPYDLIKYPIISKRQLPDSSFINGKWVKGKTSLPATGAECLVNSQPSGEPDELSAGNIYNKMSGLRWNGNSIIDPVTGNPTTFMCGGDPETNAGWVERSIGGAAPGDRRMTLSSGPFYFAPGDTQEVVFAIAVARGINKFNSVTELKKFAKRIPVYYQRNFYMVDSVPSPAVSVISGDKKAVLYWTDNAESYNFIDESVLPGKNKVYDFEGYQVFQYADSKGSNPQLIATFDKVNADSIFSEQTLVYGVPVNVPQITGKNSGIQRVLHISNDQINRDRLYNSKEYYFGVVAFAYNPDGEQRIVRSMPSIVTVIPQPDAIGDAYPKRFSQSFSVTKTGRAHDGLVSNYIVDEKKLTGHIYEVEINKSTDTTQLFWSLKDLNTGVVLLKNKLLQAAPASQDDILVNADIVDGFAIKVSDPGNSSRRVKEV
ncbi:MAG: hypothetical protein HYV28_19785, partial [Ignavibacteriales bacterium]|nr:hypothetical protein [Ignavibacteriales bacterium]